MIRNVYIMNKESGLCLLSKTYGSVAVNEQIFTAVIKAMESILKLRGFQQIVSSNYKILKTDVPDTPFSVVIVSDPDEDEFWLKGVMNELVWLVMKNATLDRYGQIPTSVSQRLSEKIDELVQEEVETVLIPVLRKNVRPSELLDMKILSLCDGKHSVEDISRELNIPVGTILIILSKYHRRKVLDYIAGYRMHGGVGVGD